MQEDAVRGGPVPGPLPVFPAGHWWNQDISGAPVDPQSPQFINFIGASRGLHPDFGGYDLDNPALIYGLPYVVVGGDQPKQTVHFYYADQSDGVNHSNDQSYAFYPIPEEAKTQSYWIEGGPPGNANLDGDRHMLILDRDNRHLYELFDLRWTGERWEGGSGAFFDLNRSDRRPEGWTSADAAGLAIFPGLVRRDEAMAAAEIGHAFRVTVRSTNGYVWPASHVAGDTGGALPMGARLRLKSTVNFSSRPAYIQRIFRAMQRYGLIVADNGSDMYISGTFDPAWDNGELNPAFSSLKASDFEVVQLGWRGPSGPCVSPGAPVAFNASVSGARVTMTWHPPAAGTVEGYAIEAGSQAGASDLAFMVLPPTQTSLVVDAPPGTYFVRVRAGNSCGTAATPDTQIFVPSGCTLPTPPAQPAASVAGSVVTLGWNAVPGASGYVLEAGSAAGAADVLRTPVAELGIAGVAPPGTYYVRVRAQNACGVGAPSPERTVIVGGCAVPTPSGPLTSIVMGNNVTLQWAPMAGATAYRIEVGSGSGAANVIVADVPTNALSTPAPPGVYYVRIRGISACGAGSATNEVVVRVEP